MEWRKKRFIVLKTTALLLAYHLSMENVGLNDNCLITSKYSLEKIRFLLKHVFDTRYGEPYRYEGWWNRYQTNYYLLKSTTFCIINWIVMSRHSIEMKSNGCALVPNKPGNSNGRGDGRENEMYWNSITSNTYSSCLDVQIIVALFSNSFVAQFDVDQSYKLEMCLPIRICVY